jgi:hypothetical protein
VFESDRLENLGSRQMILAMNWLLFGEIALARNIDTGGRGQLIY